MHVLKINNTPIEAIKLLIDNGANINLQNKNGKTALMIAVANIISHNLLIEKVKLLINANVNLQDENGKTALTYALNVDSPIEVIRLLINNNANIYLQDIKGNTALIYILLHSNKNNLIEKMKLIMKYF